MTPAPITIGRGQSLSDAARKMHEHHVRHLPVLEGGYLFGILSERDIIRQLSTDPATLEHHVSDVMTFPVVCGTSGDDVDSVLRTMTAERFVNFDTLKIILLGLVAFVFDIFGGVMFAKLLNIVLPQGKKINPMIGACGISAFPMAARVVHNLGQKEDNTNYLLMPAVSANVGGQIGSVVAGGIILALVPLFA